MAAIANAELLQVLEIESPPRRTATAPRRRLVEPLPGAYHRQGNWKRREGVATRYELAQAIDRMLERGKLEIADAVLRLARGPTARAPALTPAERWAREDDELRAYCERMDVHETSSRWAGEIAGIGSADMFDAVKRSAPRPGVGVYVERELRVGASSYLPLVTRRMTGDGYAAVIETIAERGGLEWELEPARRVGDGVKPRRRT